MENPDKSHVDEMLAFAVKTEREYMSEVAAYVQTPADIVEQAQVVYGEPEKLTVLVVGLGDENFASLSPELIQKYAEQFKTPEVFMQVNGKIVSIPIPAPEQDKAHLPDRFETGERIQTPRGSFAVTNLSREQMEAAGYGYHHSSDDKKYLIMGNGTRAFAIPAEQPEKDNPLRMAEMTIEDDYGMIDGVINNGRRGEEPEKEKETTGKKPSIRERLEDTKREYAEHKPTEVKKPSRDAPEHSSL